MRTYVRMRWDEQRVENDLRLPGVGDGTVVRTFDAPEAMGINFHEVRAKSALNHVPGGRYGFDWTINPYRGCSHACVYCLGGETPILMADGTSRRLEDVRPGDSIYGTVRRGSYRALRADSGPRPLGDRETRLQGDARRRDRADRQRRSSIPHGARLEVRDRGRTGARPASASDQGRTSWLGLGGYRSPRRNRDQVAGGPRCRLDRAAGPVDADVRHHHRDRRLHRQRGGQPQLLRSPHPHVSRLRRGPGLRARDRRQGQPAGAAAGGAGAAGLEAGAGGAGDQHRPLPVGREPLPDDAGDPRRAGGGEDPRLGADQVAAGDARRRALRADGEAGAAGLGQPLGPDPRRGRLAGDRAAHAEPRRAARRGRRAAPPRDRLRRPRRAADAGDQRQPRAGPRRSSTPPRPPAPPSSAASPSTSATRSKTSSSPGWKPNAPTSSPATRPSTATAPTCAPSNANRPPEPSAAGATPACAPPAPTSPAARPGPGRPRPVPTQLPQQPLF